ncbi:MAG: DUF45 domain-containing protein [Alphaproteobacteria bacterium]|nr:DUF45 domain-containing protein [Rickettsiales bacterium]
MFLFKNKNLSNKSVNKKDYKIAMVSFKYFIKHSARVKKVSFLIPNKDEIIVRAPIKLTHSKVIKLIEHNAGKIEAIMQKIVQKNQCQFKTNLENKINAHGFCIQFNRSVNNDELKISNKTNESCTNIIIEFTNENSKQFYKNIIKAVFFISKQYLPPKVEEISQRTGLRYKSMKIKTVKTIWGSCSSKKNINLSSRLILLPKNLIEYVITHELVHTKHQNHGKLFWAELNFLMDDKAKELDKLLLKTYYPLKDIFESSSMRFDIN